MFTTIAKLRASSAMQSRVTTVENWLKKQNAAWTPDSKFPIAFIAHSNSTDDVSWVNGVSSTHVSWPELAEAVLKQFGHKTQTEHRDALYEMLEARSPGKNKVLAETVVPKYNAALKSLGQKADFGSVMWPFTIDYTAVETPVTEAVQSDASEEVVSAQEAVAGQAQTDVFKPLAQVAAETAQAAPQVEAASQEFTNAVEGAMFIGLGKVMIEKNKKLVEAAKYAVSPTGGRLFSEYVHAFASGIEIKDVRVCLKAFVARNG